MLDKTNPTKDDLQNANRLACSAELIQMDLQQIFRAFSAEPFAIGKATYLLGKLNAENSSDITSEQEYVAIADELTAQESGTYEGIMPKLGNQNTVISYSDLTTQQMEQLKDINKTREAVQDCKRDLEIEEKYTNQKYSLDTLYKKLTVFGRIEEYPKIEKLYLNLRKSESQS